jgi:hypothetical protein
MELFALALATIVARSRSMNSHDAQRSRASNFHGAHARCHSHRAALRTSMRETFAKDSDSSRRAR